METADRICELQKSPPSCIYMGAVVRFVDLESWVASRHVQAIRPDPKSQLWKWLIAWLPEHKLH